MVSVSMYGIFQIALFVQFLKILEFQLLSCVHPNSQRAQREEVLLISKVFIL